MRHGIGKAGYYKAAVATVFALVFAVDSFAAHAPITPEMLASLRAKGSKNASYHPSRAAIDFDFAEGKLKSIEYADNNATLSSACLSLQKVFNVLISCEGPPQDVSFGTTYTFDYKIQANERLVDALDRLVEATGEQMQWRLLDGRLIMISAPKEEAMLTPIGDRIVPVNIQADTFWEAMLQLEVAYNQQHKDIPLGVVVFRYHVAQKTAADGNGFHLQGEYPLRNIIVTLLNQMDTLHSSYFLLPKPFTRSPRDKNANGYYYDHDLYYYGLTFMGFPEESDAENDYENLVKSGRMKEADAVRTWSATHHPELSKRLKQYFDSIHPDLAAQKDATSATEPERHNGAGGR